MGQPKHFLHRDRGSSGVNFLSPHAGASSVPMVASLAQFLPYAVGVFGLAFLASCITASIMTPVQNSDAISSLDLNTSAVSYYVNIASNNGDGGTISKDIQATYAGTIGVITDTLQITSNTPNGYYVYVSAANGYDQNLTNTTDSSYYLSPIDTTTYSVSNPGTLSTENTWGVAVGSTYNSNYDAASNYTDATVSQATKFGPVPAYGSEELLITRTGSTYIEEASSDSSLATVDTIPVYYGYLANSALPSGTYSDTVLYTAYAEATETDGGIATYTGDIDYVNGGTATFTTSLYTDRDVDVDDVELTVGGTAATVTSVSKVDAGNNDSVVVVATLPAQAKPGNYDAVLTISKFGHSSTTSIAYDTPGIVIESGEYAGTYKTMQSMTTEVCAAWDDTPAAFTTGDGPIYKYGSSLDIPESTIVADPATNWSSVTATEDVTSGSAVSNINTNVPETYLKDSRDGNWYRIRKLADGNCWMTENLRLVFSTDGSNVIGKVKSDGTIEATDQTINEDNSNVGASAVGGSSASNFNATTFAEELAYTETSSNKTIWGAETGTKHSSSTTSVDNDETHNAYSMEYSRSYYNSNAYNKNNKTNFLNDDDEQTVGTYYNWKAATAGTGTIADISTTKTDSICPKGWQLPVDTAGSGKSWVGLIFNTYGGGKGYNASTNPDGISQGNAWSGSAYYQTVNGAHIIAMSQTMRRAPLSLSSSGSYYYTSGTVNNIGYAGYFWYSESHSNRYTYNFNFSGDGLYPYNGNNKGNGITVRCVAQ